MRGEFRRHATGSKNGAVRMVARFACRSDFPKFLQKHRDSFGPLHPWSRLIQSRRTLHIADYSNDRAYLGRDPVAIAGVELGGIRTLLAVPMLKDDELVGFVTIFRQEVRPFTDKQIELVSNFANQAVIAIENARLVNELRERTDDLTEALEEQTATSEVLQVISGSPSDLEPVFAAMLGSATRICEARFGNLFLREGETFHLVAWHGEPTYVENWRREPLTIKTDLPEIPLARLAETKQRVHVADLRQEAAYKAGFAPLVALVDIRPTQSDTTLGHRLKDRPKVECRAADDFKHICRRCLLLQCFGEVSGALAEVRGALP